MRRSLFQDNNNRYTPVRRKLFSLTDNSTVKQLRCADCGYELESRATSTTFLCPRCGGKRFNVMSNSQKTFSNYVSEERISLFDDESIQLDTEPMNDSEHMLRMYSGDIVPTNVCEKLFGMSADEMVEKSFAEYDDNNDVKISEDAYLKSKLFSKLIISVTKVLDLDPKITCCPDPEEERVRAIRRLESCGSLCPQSIILIKKAHGIDPSCCTQDDISSWAKDSGILGDLRAEFGGSCISYPSFKRTIEDRYPDAPRGILDLLEKRGILKINGDHVNIL